MENRIALSVTEVAAALGVSRPTVYTLLHRADFPAFHVGNRTLISADGLRQWVAQQSSTSEVREWHR